MKFIIAASLAFAALAAFPTVRHAHAAPAADDVIRIGVAPWPGYEYLWLAEQRGYFVEEGISIHMVDLMIQSDAPLAFERGQIDGYCATIYEMMSLRNSTPRSPQVTLVIDSSDGADVLLAGPEITCIADLRGKRVGVVKGTVNMYLLASALRTVGMTVSDVVVVPMLDGESKFLSGSVDAVVSFAPASLKLLATGRVHEIFSSKDIPGEIVDILLVDKPIIDRHPDLPAAIMRAWAKVIRYVADHPEEAYRLMGAREKISGAMFREAVTEGMRMEGFDQQPAFFGPEGTLTRTIARTDALLREVGEASGPDRTGDCLAPLRFPIPLVLADHPTH